MRMEEFSGFIESLSSTPNNFIWVVFTGLILASLAASIFWIIYQHRRYKKLQELHGYTDYIVKHTPNLAVRMLPGGDILMVNPAVLRASGYDEDELVGKNWWRVFHPDGRKDPEILEINEISDWGRIPLANHEMTLRQKNGEKRRISWNTANRGGPDGEINEMVAIGIDITDRKKRAKWEQEEGKMRALAHMTGGLAHEINNVLQPILGMADVALQAVETEKENKRLTEALEILHQNALHARSIVQNILFFSRSDEQTKSKFDAVDLIGHTIDFIEQSVDSNVDIIRLGFLDHFENDKKPKYDIYVAQTAVTQVLQNLIKNAEQAMNNDGTVHIDMDIRGKEDLQTLLVGMDSDQYIIVKVTDNGPGIDAETQRMLFEPFFTTKPVGSGTGLGLSTAYGLVKSWNGAITVDSVEGMGSTFTVYIPVMNPLLNS